jgi:hypothetical protein
LASVAKFRGHNRVVFRYWSRLRNL